MRERWGYSNSTTTAPHTFWRFFVVCAGLATLLPWTSIWAVPSISLFTAVWVQGCFALQNLPAMYVVPPRAARF